MDLGYSLFKIGKHNYSCIVRANSFQYYEVELRGSEGSKDSLRYFLESIKIEGNNYLYYISPNEVFEEQIVEELQVIFPGDFIKKNNIRIVFLSSSPREYISVNLCNIKPAK